MLDKYAKNSTNINPVAMMCGYDNRFKKKSIYFCVYDFHTVRHLYLKLKTVCLYVRVEHVSY